MLRTGLTFTLIFLLALFRLHGQEDGKTRIIYSGDSWQFNKDIYPDGPRLIGNVVMNHDSAYLYCDSAWVNEKENRVIAFGNVRIKLSDTLNLYCDSLKYSGNSKIAHANSNVRLIDNQTILTTDTLVYDRNTQIAQYNYWGKIVNKKNILVSRFGYYYTDRKEFFFKEKVHLLNPGYSMRSDTLMYNTVTEIAYFFGPSDIVSKDGRDSIYCENGWYDTRLDISRFRKRAKIYHIHTFITGDSLYYERENEYGQIFKNAQITDTVRNIVITGNYGELHQKKGFAFMTDSAVTVLAEKDDSLFLHADTIRAAFDSSNQVRQVQAYFKARFFRKDMQGKCDSLLYTATDSSVTMVREPVLWSDSNQLTADSIRLQMRNGEADSLKMFGSAFIISRDDPVRYNQIKGRNVLAKFNRNQLYKINVLGNAQTIYYAREEDRTLIGVNTAVSSDMLIFLNKNQIESITFIGNPDAHTSPESEVPENERLLRDFQWLEDQRPKNRYDIFSR